jgi:hypothetical protein
MLGYPVRKEKSISTYHVADLSWWHIAQGVAAIITILMAISLVPIAKLISKIRTNDLHHLDEKTDLHHAAVSLKIDMLSDKVRENIDTVQKSVDNVQKSVDKVEMKIDDHIMWHITKSQKENEK